MKTLVIIGVVIAAVAGGAYYWGVFTRDQAQAATAQAGANQQETNAGRAGNRGGGGGPFGGGGFGGFGGGRGGPMTVEVAAAHRGTVQQRLVVVGNLIGDTTVTVAPRAAGRLQEITVRLGDRVRRGQQIAKIEDFELQEQVKQQEAALEVSRATIRQREADLKLAETNAERSRNLYARQLLPKQTLDDTEARYQAAVAQLDLARAQNTQSTARLDELRINLDNTIIVSPVNGFVARRAADPGAFVSQNAPIADVVDISRVRLVANIVEKDLKQLQVGDDTIVDVDAFPGETFVGRIARVAPVLDPATRTASIEIEIPNPGFRLKPGMYARVSISADERKDALVVPSNAVVDLGGRRGVFLAAENNTVSFTPVTVGIEESDQIEVLQGLTEGDRVVTTGAAALRDGDRVVLAGRAGAGGGGGNPPGDRQPQAGDATPGQIQGNGASAEQQPQLDGPSGDGTGRRGLGRRSGQGQPGGPRGGGGLRRGAPTP